ncbi:MULTISPECIES: hypothetical protein [Empedobacter]|uniref:hypothetical protein n=1 Tax=Empedobacter TaxID=59734 RepID=UPI001362444B|nr:MULTISPECIES: hypothetical protein [Empedobacter]
MHAFIFVEILLLVVNKRADYILYYKPNIPIGIIEIKENNHSVGAGMQQGLEYAAILNLSFFFSTRVIVFYFMIKPFLIKLKLNWN